MKRKLIFTILLYLVSHITIGQVAVSGISFPKNAHNFGTFNEEDGPVSVDFEVINDTTSPLLILRVASSCGCTSPEWTKEPLGPGAKGFVRATYDPKGRPGPFDKTITVYTNLNPSGVVLTIRGNVIPRPLTADDIYRRRLNNLGLTATHMSLNRVFIPNTITDTIGIYNFGDTPIKLTFENVPGHLRVSSNPETLKPKEKGTLRVTFDSKKRNDWGFVVDRFGVLVNGERAQNNLISISASIEEDFTALTEVQRANAPRIEFKELNKDFGNVNEGDEIKHQFEFTNTGKSDLIIRKIKASCGCTTVNPVITVIKPGQKSSLSALFKTTGFSGRQSKTITVITNDPQSPNLTLRISGTITSTNK